MKVSVSLKRALSSSGSGPLRCSSCLSFSSTSFSISFAFFLA